MTSGMHEGDKTRVLHLPLDAIRPNPAQPRHSFDSVALSQLAASLREHGVLQPVLVRPLDEGRYELIAGERRWQAAHLAGLDTLPVLIVHASPRRALELALIENLQRADLSALEEADAYRGLMTALGLTQERLAERLGISRVAVTNRLRLLTLGEAAREALAAGQISEGHARALLAVPVARQDEAVRLVIAGGLSVRLTERLARRLAAHAQSSEPRVRPEADATAVLVEERLRRALGTRVRARRRGDGLSVLLHFHSVEAAAVLLDLLDPDQDGLDGDDL